MTFGPRTFGSQVSRPPSCSDSKRKPTSRYDRGLQAEKNGLTTSCAGMSLPRSSHDNATAEPSCGKNICCSSTAPGASWNRDSGQGIAPKSPPLKVELESAPELFDEIV